MDFYRLIARSILEAMRVDFEDAMKTSVSLAGGPHSDQACEQGSFCNVYARSQAVNRSMLENALSDDVPGKEGKVVQVSDVPGG